MSFDNGKVTVALDGKNPDADCKTPGMDLRANDMRTIQEDDQVHESVKQIGLAGKFDANNPPQELKIVNDDGVQLERGFGG